MSPSSSSYYLITANSAITSFLSGGVGGVCTVLVGHPFDLIKVKIQTGGAASSSVFKMLRETFVKEGIAGCYRGVSAPLLATSPMFAVSFWGYDMGKRIVQSSDESYQGDAGAYPFTIKQLCIAGGISAIPATMIMAPSERLKCLLQIYPDKYTSLLDCAKKVYAEGGVQSVFRGTSATLLRDIPGSIAWFGTYELVKKGLIQVQGKESGDLSPLAILCAGGVAGMACWSISIPADVLKSRYQTAPAGTYSGILDVYRHLMKEEGPKALFKGMRPAMVRAFPANAACFFGMEVSKKAFAFMD
jgi:solute carrier family 25 carnitine/acylcarnitine transporter 20/29